MQPPRIKPGQEIKASFLNYCRDGVAAIATMQKGIQGNVRHESKIGKWAKCDFTVNLDTEIPAFSIFYIKEPLSYDYPPGTPVLQVQQAPGSSGSELYTNGSGIAYIDNEFYPYLVSGWRVHQLATDVTNPPAAGDYAKPKSNDWTVEKGGESLLCLTDPDTDNLAWYLGLPTGSGQQAVGGVVNANIEPESLGEVELYDEFDVPNGTILTVLNPHKVTFYKENVIVGEEAPADRVILFEVTGWSEPLIFPFMLSECESIDPVFSPVDA